MNVQNTLDFAKWIWKNMKNEMKLSPVKSGTYGLSKLPDSYELSYACSLWLVTSEFSTEYEEWKWIRIKILLFSANSYSLSEIIEKIVLGTKWCFMRVEVLSYSIRFLQVFIWIENKNYKWAQKISIWSMI